MKISIELVKQLSQQEKLDFTIDKLVQKINSQLGAIEQVIDFRGKYHGIKIAEITEAGPHPNADQLNIYQAYDGSEHFQVVSGDKQLNVGDKVAWVAPGSTLPNSWGSDRPVVMEVKLLRGQMSHGMFASGRELDINNDHDGVLILDTDKPAGTSIADAYKLDDVIINIENKMFTHRPDCFGILGVARELLGIQGKPFTSPEWYAANTRLPEAETDLSVTLQNTIPNLVPRFVAIAVQDVKVGPSPFWLQAKLRQLGLRSINNIVDITNYIMVLTGQPLHAYDYDKLTQIANTKHAELVVRQALKDEKLNIITGKEVVLHPQTMVVAAGKKAIGVGGIMGGAETEVSQTTTNIVLEAATWDMYSIRRAGMRHGLFTDALTRFSKGQSPLQNVAVVNQAIDLIKKLAGGKIGKSIDNNHVNLAARQQGSLLPPVGITADFVNSRLGTKLNSTEIVKTLANVEFSVEEHGDELLVRAPFWRTDIQIVEDIVEEVGRLNGYDKISQVLPMRPTLPATIAPIDDLKSKVRRLLSAAGANELQTYSFVADKLLQDVGQAKIQAFKIRNALSPELQHYRLSLTPSLLEKVHPNIKAGFDEFVLFETNKVHIKGDQELDGLPREYQTIALTYAAKNKLEGAPYYWAKKYMDYLLGNLGINYKILPAKQKPQWEIGRQVFAPFEPSRSSFVIVEDEFTGFIGEYNFKARKSLKLPEFCAGFELDLERILKHVKPTTYKKLLKFPVVEQDVCLRVNTDVSYNELKESLQRALQNDGRIKVALQPVDIYQREPEHKQITFRLILQHSEKTLTTDEVNSLVEQALYHAQKDTGAERI